MKEPSRDALIGPATRHERRCVSGCQRVIADLAEGIGYPAIGCSRHPDQCKGLRPSGRDASEGAPSDRSGDQAIRVVAEPKLSGEVVAPTVKRSIGDKATRVSISCCEAR